MRLTFEAWDAVMHDLGEMSNQAQREADWTTHRDITKAIELLRKLWEAKTGISAE